MENQTVSLHRIIKTTPDKLFRAFSDPIAHANWLPPYGFLCTIQEMNFKIGGGFKMTFINFSTGSENSFGGKYLEIIPEKLIKYSDLFDDPNLPGEMITTINLRAVIGGTELKVLQSNIPTIIPQEMCYLGWQESLDKLTKLVEPEIPDA